MIDYDEYENLPPQDKWMAHATMPASAFFRLWKRKFEKLVWMALYDPKGRAGTAQWYISATTPQEEEDMLASDDDFEPDEDEHGGIEEDGSESDGDNDMSDGDGQISSEEVNDLMEDAYGEEAHKRKMQLQSEESTAAYQLVNMPTSEPADRRQPLLGSLDRKTKVGPSLPVKDASRHHFGEWRLYCCKLTVVLTFRKSTVSIRAMVGRQVLIGRHAGYAWLNSLRAKKVQSIKFRSMSESMVLR